MKSFQLNRILLELTHARRLAIALDVAQGLAHLHSLQHPIIHRDLHAKNIMVIHSTLTPLITNSHTSQLDSNGVAKAFYN